MKTEQSDEEMVEIKQKGRLVSYIRLLCHEEGHVRCDKIGRSQMQELQVHRGEPTFVEANPRSSWRSRVRHDEPTFVAKKDQLMRRICYGLVTMNCYGIKLKLSHSWTINGPCS